jgi:hypothetical protein
MWWTLALSQTPASDLSVGTAGTGRVHPRRAAGTVFFSKLYPTHLIPVPVAGTRVGGSNVITIY